MSDIIPVPPGSNGPWRVVVLDSSADDPKWLIATVTLSEDVRPAQLSAADRYTDWDETAEWVRGRVGQRVRLVPVSATVWRIDAEGSVIP